MTHSELVERAALDLYNRYRKRVQMKPVDHIGANDTDACNSCRADARAALAAVYEAIKEPTDKMVRAAMRRNRMDDPFASADVTAYRAMLAASPLNPEAGE
jgi:hypothetical protein